MTPGFYADALGIPHLKLKMSPTLGRTAGISLDSCKYKRTELAVRMEGNTATRHSLREHRCGGRGEQTAP